MDNYKVQISPKAAKMLKVIYAGICYNIEDSKKSEKRIAEIKAIIFSLDQMPYRGAEIKVGAYANQGFRKLISKNYVIIYDIIEDERVVNIISVMHKGMK